MTEIPTEEQAKADLLKLIEGRIKDVAMKSQIRDFDKYSLRIEFQGHPVIIAVLDDNQIITKKRKKHEKQRKL